MLLVANRKYYISLRDAGDVEIGASAPAIVWPEAYDAQTPYADETIAYPQIIQANGANYIMTVPILGVPNNLPGDVWTATNATINSQVWNGVDSWILDITNDLIPPLAPGDPVELRMTGDPARGTMPPQGTVLVYDLV